MKDSDTSQDIMQLVKKFVGHHPHIVQIIVDFFEKYPPLAPIIPDILKVYLRLIDCFDNDHKLFICGNGGSFADSMHISGELLKSFARKRGLSDEDKKAFNNLPYGAELSEALEYGFPVIVLGLNHSLFTALENDNSTRYIGYAQELYALGSPGDIFLGISTSGNAKNVLYAVSTAKAKGLSTIALTGEHGGELGAIVEIPLKVPGKTTAHVQEFHILVYHTICEIVEAHYFQERK